MTPRVDEHTISGKYRTAGVLGPVSSCFTLAWLASHRGRLRTLLLGGKKLGVLVMWDSQGGKTVDRSADDERAIAQLVYGRVPAAMTEEGQDGG